MTVCPGRDDGTAKYWGWEPVRTVRQKERSVCDRPGDAKAEPAGRGSAFWVRFVGGIDAPAAPGCGANANSGTGIR
ncbi:hypothetical protein KNP414_02358 [Paenibacillus mucilaginosus KNP414]|uniref:Uncharacterized protein n=1 Tax=Paenibacillus mucilaginosus (strain KNP414) TaxID=1036673 RepID=F8F5A8_PAEMK|nr:hypothetical protein KNP414_02358 [Paenibacillus mucilaginosus KNP414]